MRRGAGTVRILLAGLLTAAPAGAAQKERPAAPVPVAILMGRVQQAGPAYPGHPAAIEVQVRNVGKTECGVCQVRVLGGGVAASQPLPPVRPGEAAKVIVGGMVFPRPGKVVLSVVVAGPPDRVDFGGKKPRTTFELTVLEGSPVKRGAQR